MINERDKKADSERTLFTVDSSELKGKSHLDLGLSPSSPPSLDSQKDCDHCKTGVAQLSDYKAWKKDKTIHYYELLIRLKNHGSRCVSCMYNGINPKSKKAKVYRKIPKLHFQQLDMFEAIE
jgi:hypothetical protein